MWGNVGNKISLDMFLDDNKAFKDVAYFNYFSGASQYARCHVGKASKCFSAIPFIMCTFAFV